MKVVKSLLQTRFYSKKCAGDQPLSGIRIMDLTRIVAGPYCTMILGDLGADVIKIERPVTGDEARKWGPPFLNDTKESCYFVALNRNKRSICVDITKQQGRDILYKLSEKSDVLIENYVPGKLDELSLGYNDFAKISPHLIYCTISGYGMEGPYKNKPGYDVIAASLGGLLHITGPENGEPVKPGVAVTDLATGLYAHGAVMAALINRARTGKGQKIDCNLLSTQVASLINIGSNYLNAGKEAKRWGTAHESIVPYETFTTLNGYFTIGTGSDAQFYELCRLLERPDLAENQDYATNIDRVKNRRALITELKNLLSKQDNAFWRKKFENASFPNGPVNSLGEVFEDEHIRAIGLVEELDHFTGKIKVVGPPVKYSDGGNFIRLPPPGLGEHTSEILNQVLGFENGQIEDLKSNKIIQ